MYLKLRHMFYNGVTPLKQIQNNRHMRLLLIDITHLIWNKWIDHLLADVAVTTM